MNFKRALTIAVLHYLSGACIPASKYIVSTLLYDNVWNKRTKYFIITANKIV